MVSAASTNPARQDYIPGRKLLLPAQQALVARGHQHDDDRVGARKMLGLAVRAVALPAAFLHRGTGSAIGAIAVALMPVHHRFRHRDRRELVGRHHALHRHATQFGDARRRCGAAIFPPPPPRCPCRTPRRPRAGPGRSCRDWRRISALRRSSAARADLPPPASPPASRDRPRRRGRRGALPAPAVSRRRRADARRDREYCVTKPGCPSGNEFECCHAFNLVKIPARFCGEAR